MCVYLHLRWFLSYLAIAITVLRLLMSKACHATGAQGMAHDTITSRS